MQEIVVMEVGTQKTHTIFVVQVTRHYYSDLHKLVHSISLSFLFVESLSRDSFHIFLFYIYLKEKESLNGLHGYLEYFFLSKNFPSLYRN